MPLSFPLFFNFANFPRNLNPGGWIEAADVCIPHRCDDGTLKPDSAILKWGNLRIEAAQKIGRVMGAAGGATLYKQQMIAAGFENVVEKVYKWPTNRWPKDPLMKEMGMCQWGEITG
jgi:hypothetical protein